MIHKMNNDSTYFVGLLGGLNEGLGTGSGTQSSACLTVYCTVIMDDVKYVLLI